MASYTEILAKAREHDSTVSKQMRGWAVEVHHGKSVLMCYWFNKNKDVSAHAVYIDDSGDASLDMIAGHLNEKNGSGPLTIAALVRIHRENAELAGGRKEVAEVVKVAGKSIN